MRGPPECLACGTCCFSRLETYVPVTGDDHARLGDLADDLVVFHGNKAYLRMEDGHCAALRIDAVRGAFFCTAYDVRPAACRELDRGSPACAGEIAEKGERPLILLERVRRGDAGRDPAP